VTVGKEICHALDGTALANALALAALIEALSRALHGN